MEDPENICQTCLSSGRKLVSTSKIRSVLEDIKFTELEKKSICWECHRIIMRFYRFKIQAKKAQTALNKKLKKFKTFSRFLNITKNNFDYELVHNYDHLPSKNVLIENEETDLKFTPITKLEKTKEINANATESFVYDFDSDDNKKLQVFVDVMKKEEKVKKKSSLLKTKKIAPLPKTKEIKDYALLKEKFKTVSLTEEEVVRRREEKRCHPNFKRLPFKCDMCVLGFVKVENYDLHIKKYHEKSLGSNICKVCSIRFAKESSLKRHQNKHYFLYACALCEYETSAWKAAVNHCVDKHALDEKNRIHCKQCSGVFRTPEELDAHKKTDHLLYCNECGEKFKGHHTLRTHRVRIHSVKRDFACEICRRTFQTRSRLESHMIRHGQALARRLAYCAMCNVQYKNIQVYRNHLRNSVEHSKDRYQCPECKKKFASKEYWNKHYNFYHLKKSQYKCEACDKLFISKWRLKNHSQKHHGVSRSRDHGCDDCGKRFYTLTTLRSHMLTHSEHRSYMCSDCGDTFKQRAALYTHERRIHRGREAGGSGGNGRNGGNEGKG